MVRNGRSDGNASSLSPSRTAMASGSKEDEWRWRRQRDAAVNSFCGDSLASLLSLCPIYLSQFVLTGIGKMEPTEPNSDSSPSRILARARLFSLFHGCCSITLLGSNLLAASRRRRRWQ
ncbi:uncharacterized protein DS421_1g16260 [Arachis hypogaea]|nr:uncharacterized protein DS421_1g16260 [Arachis hypogaea]